METVSLHLGVCLIKIAHFEEGIGQVHGKLLCVRPRRMAGDITRSRRDIPPSVPIKSRIVTV